MPAEAHEGEPPIDVLLRILGEYSAKVASGLRLRTRARVLTLIGGLGLASTMLLPVAVLMWPAPSIDSDMVRWIAYGAGLVFALVFGSGLGFWMRDSSSLELAVWQLRRSYELASRVEDVGSAVDYVHRLEFELRLSEAQFLLNRAVRAGMKGEPRSSEVGRAIRKREHDEKGVAPQPKLAARRLDA